MDVVMGATASLAPKLLQLLRDEYKLQKGVRKQVEVLSRDLESIKVALGRVAEMPWDDLDEDTRQWRREMREASYDMEDVIDTFVVRVEGKEPPDPSKLKCAANKLCELVGKTKTRHGIARSIEDIEKKLQEAANRHSRYGLGHSVARPAPATSVDLDPRLSAFFKASQLVGIRKPRDELIEILSIGKDDDTSIEKIKIVTIVGSGGSGKTTLAKAVYDKVKSRFDSTAFVTVGRNPDATDVLKEILIDLNENEMANTSFYHDKKTYNSFDLWELKETHLINRLHRFLNGKRYFIVVDDIWETKIWDKISYAFLDNKNGSRIIATTRTSEVSNEIGGEYKIKVLSDTDSRKLFYTRTFGRKDNWPDNDAVDEVARRILRKCEGIPLAIVTVASLLASRQVEEWCNMYDSIWRGDNKHVKNTKKIISFSYQDLPRQLKPCMLYLSVFPEDRYLEKNTLIWRWIAEGLVEGEKPFEVGDNYFHELINRGMILPNESTKGIIHGCRVHDMVLSLIRDLSREENFVAILDSKKGSVSHENGNVRRLALQNLYWNDSRDIKALSDRDVPQVRSINATVCKISNKVPPVSGLQFLRVLALEYCMMTKNTGNYLQHIGKLLHLRYLGLKGTRITELSEEIGNLQKLETVMLDKTGLQELPTSLEKLSKLMCLHADKKTIVPDWIGKMTSLVDLEMYPGADGRCFVKELGCLKDLRVLFTRIDLQDKQEATDLLESLSKLQNMETVNVASSKSSDDLISVKQNSLVLTGCNLRILRLTAFRFSRLPRSINSQALPNLYILDLRVDDMKKKDLEILGSFQKLRELFLDASTLLSDISIFVEDGFKKLEFFAALFFPVKFIQGAMPSIESIQLWIPVCDVMKENLDIGFGLGNLSSLQKIDVEIDCTSCFPSEVHEAEDAVKHQVSTHHNQPTIEFMRLAEDKMKKTDLGLLNKQKHREQIVWERVDVQWHLYKALVTKANNLKDQKIPWNPRHENKMNQLMEQLSITRSRLEYEFSLCNFRANYRDLRQVIVSTVALERMLEIFSYEYPRLGATMEELEAAARILQQEQRVLETVDAQWSLYDALSRRANNLKQLKISWYPIDESKINGLMEILGHRDERMNRELSLRRNNEDNSDLRQVMQRTVALKGALKIYANEYPRLAATLEELEAAARNRLRQDDTIGNIANNNVQSKNERRRQSTRNDRAGTSINRSADTWASMSLSDVSSANIGIEGEAIKYYALLLGLAALVLLFLAYHIKLIIVKKVIAWFFLVLMICFCRLIG